jgi:hypothetical protein
MSTTNNEESNNKKEKRHFSGICTFSRRIHLTIYYTQMEFLTVPIKIYELLKSRKRVIIATDGGAIPLKGSLGFVLADEDGSILLI